MLGEGHGAMPSVFGTAKHWRERAEEARAMADEMTDPQAKAAMRTVAENYDRMAKHAEWRGRRDADAEGS